MIGRRHLSNLMSTELKILQLELWISRSTSIEETEQLIRNQEILLVAIQPGMCLKERIKKKIRSVEVNTEI